jgi:hypothetical protein
MRVQYTRERIKFMPSSQNQDQTFVEVGVFVDTVAAMVGVPLQVEHRPGVVENFVRIQAIAQSVMEFPLPEDVEGAPVFEP